MSFLAILKPIDLGGELGGDGGLGRIARLAHMARGARRIGLDHGRELQGGDGLAALTERHDVAVHGLEALHPGARQRQQLVAHPLEMLGDDIEARVRQQMVDVGDASRHRILDGDHGELRLAGLHRGKRILEGGARHRLHGGIGVAGGQMRVGAGLALEGDLIQARSGHGLFAGWSLLKGGRNLAAGFKKFARPRKVGRSIDTERDSVNEADMDAHVRL